jgi:hypothetical protein
MVYKLALLGPLDYKNFKIQLLLLEIVSDENNQDKLQQSENKCLLPHFGTAGYAYYFPNRQTDMDQSGAHQTYQINPLN